MSDRNACCVTVGRRPFLSRLNIFDDRIRRTRERQSSIIRKPYGLLGFNSSVRTVTAVHPRIFIVNVPRVSYAYIIVYVRYYVIDIFLLPRTNSNNKLPLGRTVTRRDGGAEADDGGQRNRRAHRSVDGEREE